MCGIWHFNYRSPPDRPWEAPLKNKEEQLKKKMERFLIFCLLRCQGEKQEPRADRTTGQLKSFFWPGQHWCSAKILHSWHLPCVPWSPPSKEKHLPHPCWANLVLQTTCVDIKSSICFSTLLDSKSPSTMTNEKFLVQRSWVKICKLQLIPEQSPVH